MFDIHLILKEFLWNTFEKHTSWHVKQCCQPPSLSCLQNAIQLQGSIGSRINYILHTNYFINHNLIWDSPCEQSTLWVLFIKLSWYKHVWLNFHQLLKQNRHLGRDSTKLELCFFSLILSLFQWKTLLEDWNWDIRAWWISA